MDELFALRMHEPLKKLMDRILANDCVTIDYKNKQAFFNKWVGSNTEEIPIWYAQELVNLQLIGCESGNLETGERHYYFSER